MIGMTNTSRPTWFSRERRAQRADKRLRAALAEAERARRIARNRPTTPPPTTF